MPNERTLSIIKPDAVGNNVIGKILQRFEAVSYTHLTLPTSQYV